MSETDEILKGMSDNIGADVIHSMQAKGRYASGQTAKAIETVGTTDMVQLMAPDYIDALEFGRKPTSPGAPAANPPVIERIKQWLSDKGLSLNPYAVTKNIHKKGYPGKPGVLTEPLSIDNINSRVNEGMDKLADTIANDIAEILSL